MQPTHTLGKIITVASMAATILSIYGTSARADESTCVMTKDRKIVCGKLVSRKDEPINPAPAANFHKDKQGHTFLSKGCRRQDMTLRCTVAITTKKEDDRLNVYGGGGRSSIVDFTSKAYPGVRVEINGSDYGGGSQLIMSPENEYFVDFVFDNIPEQMTRAAFLNFQTEGQNTQTIQFRNIPISN